MKQRYHIYVLISACFDILPDINETWDHSLYKKFQCISLNEEALIVSGRSKPIKRSHVRAVIQTSAFFIFFLLLPSVQGIAYR